MMFSGGWCEVLWCRGVLLRGGGNLWKVYVLWERWCGRMMDASG